MDEGVRREQFPLVLAWAVTHWKAQGMTLPRARVQLSDRSAGLHGVGFVAGTRVKHPTHMVFENDLPGYEKFMAVKETQAFRQRKRFELLLEARASDTIRKYGFCEADLWTPEDSKRAQALLERLENVRESRRSALPPGRPSGADAYLWWDRDPCYEALLEEAVEEQMRWVPASERAAYEAVKQRLLGATSLDDGSQVYLHNARCEKGARRSDPRGIAKLFG